MSVLQKSKPSTNALYYNPAGRLTRSYQQGPIPKLILSLIFIVILIVVIAIICSFLLTPERRVKSAIDSLASSYYENHLYRDLLASPKYSGDLNGTMQKYTERGFAPVPLRQIIYYNQTIESDSASFIEDYCDVNRTYVKFYPDAPFSSTAYHIDYIYSCDF